MPYADPDHQRTFVREYQAKRRAERRAIAIAYRGGCCEQCGSTDRLEFHHLNPATKKNNVPRLWNRPAEVVWAEIEKCILLCHDCHAKRHAEAREPGPLEAAFEKKGGNV